MEKFKPVVFDLSLYELVLMVCLFHGLKNYI